MLCLFSSCQKARAALEGFVAGLDLSHVVRWDHNREASSLGGIGLPYTDPDRLSLSALPLTGLSSASANADPWPAASNPSLGLLAHASCPTLTCPNCGSAPHLRPSKDLICAGICEDWSTTFPGCEEMQPGQPYSHSQMDGIQRAPAYAG